MSRFCTILRGRATASIRGTTLALSALLASTLLLALAAGPVQAQTFTFTAVLTSGQEPPPNTNTSKAFGVAFVTFNTDTGELLTGCEFLREPTLLTLVIVEARNGSRV